VHSIRVTEEGDEFAADDGTAVVVRPTPAAARISSSRRTTLPRAPFAG
jgi:Glu-tRNA(Gln) amidotransferase subunit E-like FAD-binding protein